MDAKHDPALCTTACNSAQPLCEVIPHKSSFKTLLIMFSHPSDLHNIAIFQAV